MSTTRCAQCGKTHEVPARRLSNDPAFDEATWRHPTTAEEVVGAVRDGVLVVDNDFDVVSHAVSRASGEVSYAYTSFANWQGMEAAARAAQTTSITATIDRFLIREEGPSREEMLELYASFGMEPVCERCSGATMTMDGWTLHQPPSLASAQCEHALGAL